MKNRRDFIKGFSMGIMGGAAGIINSSEEAMAAQSLSTESSVSFLAGNDRREMIGQVLKPFEKEIREGIRGKQIVIKPNLVNDFNPLQATHPDAVRGLIDFLKPFYKKKILIAESSVSKNGTMYAFEKHGYTPLEKEFKVKLVDLNQDSYSIEWILDENRHPQDIKIIDTFLNPDNYIISLARMKTHNAVVATLAIKNVVMASPVNLPDKKITEKRKVHNGGPVGINYNMFLIAHKVRPHLSIIDGFTGMEGNGPSHGTPVEHGVALASFDVVSADRIGIELMGIDYGDVGYLQWCSNAGLGQGDRSKIKIIGDDPLNHVIKYRLHDNIERQFKWKEGFEINR